MQYLILSLFLRVEGRGVQIVLNEEAAKVDKTNFMFF
jgi:hypothetical protein